VYAVEILKLLPDGAVTAIGRLVKIQANPED
jgi:hypothetical protein